MSGETWDCEGDAGRYLDSISGTFPGGKDPEQQPVPSVNINLPDLDAEVTTQQHLSDTWGLPKCNLAAAAAVPSSSSSAALLISWAEVTDYF